MHNRFIALTAAAALTFVLTACSTPEPETTPTPPANGSVTGDTMPDVMPEVGTDGVTKSRTNHRGSRDMMYDGRYAADANGAVDRGANEMTQELGRMKRDVQRSVTDMTEGTWNAMQDFGRTLDRDTQMQ